MFKPGSVAILVPEIGQVSTEWSLTLYSLTQYTCQRYPHTKIFTSRGDPIDVARERLITMAFDDGYEWLFFLDSDVIPSDNAIETLISHNLPIVSGLYMLKTPPEMAWDIVRETQGNDGESINALVTMWNTRMITVDAVGGGCLLIHRSVIETIREKYPQLPLFMWAKGRNPSVMECMTVPNPLMRTAGEDFWFCMLARASGFEINVDVSVMCGHIGTFKLVNRRVTLPGWQ